MMRWQESRAGTWQARAACMEFELGLRWQRRRLEVMDDVLNISSTAVLESPGVRAPQSA